MVYKVFYKSPKKLYSNMDNLLPAFKFCFILVMAVYAQDNEVQIEFVRISTNRLDRPQIITELIVDHLSNDIFQVICKLNKVNNLKTLKWLILSQTDGHLGLRIQNSDSSHTKSYRKPDLYSNVLGWTAIGSFDKLTSNSRYTTLGASRPVSSFNCTDARMYQCMSYFVDYNSKRRHGYIHKELNIQVTPADIQKEMLDESSSRYEKRPELTTVVHLGQTLRLQCTANIGSFKTSVKIVWMKSSLRNGGQLAPFSSGKQIVQEPKAFGSCEFVITDTLLYNVSQEDALRTSDNRLQFQCYVHITSIDWKTPEKQRQNFHFVVYSNDGHILIQNETKTKEITANTTINTGIIGGVCALVILGAAGMFWKRKYAYQGVSRAGTFMFDKKSEETGLRPDEPTTTAASSGTYTVKDDIQNIRRQRTGGPTSTFQTTEPIPYDCLDLRDLNLYDELEETSASQGQRTGGLSFTIQTTEPLQYEE